jgi:hypothetical protein
MDGAGRPESDKGRVASDETSSSKGRQESRERNDVVKSQVESSHVPADKHLGKSRGGALDNFTSKLLAHGKKFCADGKGSGNIQARHTAQDHNLTRIHELRTHRNPGNILAKRENPPKHRPMWATPIAGGWIKAAFPADP